MTNNFSTAMRRAMELTRAADMTGATRAIQDALSFGKAQPAGAAAGLPELSSHLPDPDVASVKVAPLEPTEKPGASRAHKPLSEVIRVLKVGRAKILDAPPARAPVVNTPQGAQFQSRVSSADAGSRRFKVYVPAPRNERPRGLIVMLHGCQQNADDFAVGTGMNKLAEEHNFVVAYPQQEIVSERGGLLELVRSGASIARSRRAGLDCSNHPGADCGVSGRSKAGVRGRPVGWGGHGSGAR